MSHALHARLTRARHRVAALDPQIPLASKAEACLHALAALCDVSPEAIPRHEVAKDWRMLEILPWLWQTRAPRQKLESEVEYWRQQENGCSHDPRYPCRRGLLPLAEAWLVQTDWEAYRADPLWHWQHRMWPQDRQDVLTAMEQAVIATLGEEAGAAWAILPEAERHEDVSRWLTWLAYHRHRWPDNADDAQTLVSLGQTLKEMHEALHVAYRDVWQYKRDHHEVPLQPHTAQWEAHQRRKLARQWADEVRLALLDTGEG